MSRFQPKQAEAFQALFDNQCKYLLYGGAAGGGKSYFLRWAAVGLGLYYSQKYGLKGAPIGLFSEDYPTLRDRQVIKIKQEFPPWLGELKESRDEGFIFRARPEYGEFVILLRNLDDPSKYASTEFIAECVEELTKNPVDTFEDLRFRLRFPGVSDVKFVSASNPGGTGHAWVKKLWVDPDPTSPDIEQARFKYIPAKATDNKFVSTDYLNQLKSLPETKRKAWLDGSWDVFEGQAFTEWVKDRHVVEPFKLDPSWRRYIAMDWGSNAPFSVGWYATTPEGRTYLYRELYMNGLGFEKKFGAPLTPRRLARVIIGINERAREDYEYCVADPSLWNKVLMGETQSLEGESIAEIMLNAGLKMIKGDNDRLNGLGRFREALSVAPDGKPWYQVFSTCYDTIRTTPALVYDEHRVEDIDTDGEDHCYDRDRYYFMSRPAKSPGLAEPPKTIIRRKFEEALSDYNDTDVSPDEAEWGQLG